VSFSYIIIKYKRETTEPFASVFVKLHGGGVETTEDIQYIYTHYYSIFLRKSLSCTIVQSGVLTYCTNFNWISTRDVPDIR
jgi:hypothetical protein